MTVDTQVQAAQPIDELQLKQLQIEWVPHGSVKANRYNPNRKRVNV